MRNTISILVKNRILWLPVVLFLLALVPRVTTLSHTFIVNDEPLYWEWSNDFAAALVNLDWYGTLIGKGYPSITVMWVHTLGAGMRFGLETLLGYPPAGFWSRDALDQPLVFDLLGLRRLVMGVVNALLILLIYLRARKLLGEAVAFLGAALMAFAPFLLADARTMRGDALMSSLMLLSSLDFLLFLRQKRWSRLVFSGVVFSLALLTKMTALPLAGFAVLAVAVYLFQHSEQSWSTRLRWAAVTLAVWGSVTALTVFLLWPALWVAPGEVFVFMRDYAASSIDGRLNFFWGNLTHDEPLPLFYPTAFLFRANPLVVLGVSVITILTIVSAWRLLRVRFLANAGNSKQIKWDNLWQMPAVARWTVLALGAYSVIYWLVLNNGALKRDRYLMPVFPAAMFIAAAGLLWLVKRIARRWPGHKLPARLNQGRWAWALFLLLLGLELGHVLSTHPFYYTYWSPLLGGGSMAMNAMMAEGGVDSAALVHLNQRPNAKNETVALLTARDYAPAFSGQEVRLTTTGAWVTADHVMLRQYHFQTEKMDPHLLAYLYRRPPEYVVEYQGYTWAWVYPGPAAQYYAGSLLDGQAKLLGYTLSSDTAAPDRPLHLKLFWENHGYQAADLFFVRLVDAGGFVWAETTAQPLPDFQQVVNQTGAIIESEARLDIPPGTPHGLYYLKIGLTHPQEQIDIGQFSLPEAGNKIAVEKPAHPPALSLERPVNQKLSQHLTLLGADVESPLILTSPDPPRLTLYWQADGPISQAYLVSVKLLDDSGAEIASWLGQPTHGLYPSANWQQGDTIRDPWPLDLAAASVSQPMSPGRYTLKVTLLAENGQVKGQADLGRLEVIDRLRLFEPPPLQYPANVQLGQSIKLLGYDLAQAPLTGGARLTTTLYWQARTPIPQDYTVFVQVLGPNGTLVGQHDSPPAGGRLPTSIWETGEIVPDRHQIDFPVSQIGEYRIIAGMYDPVSGARLPISDANGATIGDFWSLDTFKIEN